MCSEAFDEHRVEHASPEAQEGSERPLIKLEVDADLTADASGTLASDSSHPPTKLCTRCKTLQPGTSFFRDSSKATGLTSWCKCCFSDYCAAKDAAPCVGGIACASGATGLRSCRLCHLSKPASDFVRDSRRNTGLDARCKVCRREQHRVRKEVRVAGRPAVTEKACRRCGSTKPASAFKKHAYTSSGLDSWCKACCSERRREKVKPRVYAPTVGHKACIRCGEDKAAGEFTRDTGKRTGLGARCKACENEYRKEKRTFKRSQGPSAVTCGADGTQSGSSGAVEAAAGASGSDDAEATCSPNLAADVAVGHGVELPWRDGSVVMRCSHFCDDAGGAPDLPSSSGRWRSAASKRPLPESPPRPPRRPRSTRTAAAAEQSLTGTSISKVAWLLEAQERLLSQGTGHTALPRCDGPVVATHSEEPAVRRSHSLPEAVCLGTGDEAPLWSHPWALSHGAASSALHSSAEAVVAPQTLHPASASDIRPDCSDSDLDDAASPMHDSLGMCCGGDRGWTSLSVPSLEAMLQLGGLDGSDDDAIMLGTADFDLLDAHSLALTAPDLGALGDAECGHLGDACAGLLARCSGSSDSPAGDLHRPLSPICFDIFSAAHDVYPSPLPPPLQPPPSSARPHPAMSLVHLA